MISLKNVRQGFTMVEILIGMALVAILSLASMVGWRIQIAKARDAQRMSDLDKTRVALEQYYDDHLCYPDETVLSQCESEALDPYLPLVLCDPINNATFKYRYVKEDCNTFRMFAKLENDSSEAIVQSGCGGGCGPTGDVNYNYYVASGDVQVGAGAEEGVEPTCGAVTKYCFANICGSCCPGDNYRCNGAGNRCVFDATCSP